MKMMEEGKKPEEGGEDLREKDHPLSREGWIMLLSGEINKEEMKLTTYEYIGLAIRIAFFGAAVAVLVAAFRNDDILLYILCLAMIILMGLPQLIYKKYYLYPHQKRVKPLINTREAIISSDLTVFGKMWEEYIKNKYKLNDKEEKTEEKSLSKSIKKQKEVLQVPQNDIRDIKESLQEIKDMLEGTKFFGMWFTLGSIFIAVGILGISMGASLWSEGSHDRSRILFFTGILLVCSGGLMICAAHYAGTDVKKYPNKRGIKTLTELWDNIKWLLLAILIGFTAVIVLLIPSFNILLSLLFEFFPFFSILNAGYAVNCF